MNTPTPATIENVTFEELHLGRRAQMQRVVTMDDIKAFAAVSGDVNPAHLDVAYAESTRFHGVIAHGMLAGAFISSVLGTEFPGAGTIYMEQSLRFLRPVRVGDTLTVIVEVAERNDTNRNVRLACSVLNQKGEPVVEGQALVRAPSSKIVRPRPATPEMHLFDPEARLIHWVDSLPSAAAQPCAVVHPCHEVALRTMSAFMDNVGAMLIAASVMNSGRGYAGTSKRYTCDKRRPVRKAGAASTDCISSSV